jgi:mono/diheme cytochrome c family protein
MRRLAFLVLLAAVLVAPALFARLTSQQLAALPPPAQRPVSFKEDVKPVLEARCIKCHARGRSKGGFHLDNRELLLKGGDSGAAILPGKSQESYLIELVSGVDPDNVMPKKGTKLTKEQVGILRAWIDQGAPWDSDITFAKPEPLNLKPHKPDLPTDKKGNSIDVLLSNYFASNKVQRPKPIDDRLFARRVYLDVIGLLPLKDELETFLKDRSPDKRAKLVRRLLADNQHYAEHWLTFWNDMLRNDYRGTGYIDGGRKQISAWLFSALFTNMPYDHFVAQLIHPTPESEGFVKGIVWRGVVNASQTPEMQAAQNISQVFMGVNLKCASCHDSFINDWTLADAYALANIYSETNLELFECDKPTGKHAARRFIYPQLGDIDANATKSERQAQLAQLIISREDGRLSRTIVNRLWARFMGRGLVEPLDDMESPPWHSGVLDWLAEDLVASGYDLTKTIERILTSDAYQWPAVPVQEQKDTHYVFRGPTVRRMSAEQFVDSLGCIAGVWHGQPAGEFDFSVLGSQASKPGREIKWIWNSPDAATKAAPGRVYFRKLLVLGQKPTNAVSVVACDNSFTFYVNGEEISSGKDFGKPVVKDLTGRLKIGTNIIAVAAINHTPDNKIPPEGQLITGGENPAGLYVLIRWAENSRERELGTDKSWICSTEMATNWNKPNFDASSWIAASELGDASLATWKIENKITAALAANSLNGRVRSALVAADPLTVALGRPTREQVITSRPSAATTLQALELTNGRTLTSMLREAAGKLVSEGANSVEPVVARKLADDLYLKALGRKPTASELKSAEEILGNPVQREGVEDLLWAMVMLPEYQLIY